MNLLDLEEAKEFLRRGLLTSSEFHITCAILRLTTAEAAARDLDLHLCWNRKMDYFTFSKHSFVATELVYIVR